MLNDLAVRVAFRTHQQCATVPSSSRAPMPVAANFIFQGKNDQPPGRQWGTDTPIHNTALEPR